MSALAHQKYTLSEVSFREIKKLPAFMRPCINSALYEYKNKSASTNSSHRNADCLLKYPSIKPHQECRRIDIPAS